MPKSYTGEYWDTIINKKSYVDNHEDFWRGHRQEVYQELMDRWMDNSQGGLALKTDLYDEAVSEHNIITICRKKSERVIGTDVSFEVVMAARRRMIKDRNGWYDAVCSDVRNLPFKSESFDQIVSISTLDHFPRKESIRTSLKELFRLMKPGGSLLITLDNPSNPIVFLRNLSPYRLLKFFRFIPFYMGKTLSGPELSNVLESIGFTIQSNTAIVHSPRIFAIWMGFVLDRIATDKIKVHFRKFLTTFERLEKFPIKYLSGYFVAVKAIKR